MVFHLEGTIDQTNPAAPAAQRCSPHHGGCFSAVRSGHPRVQRALDRPISQFLPVILSTWRAVSLSLPSFPPSRNISRTCMRVSLRILCSNRRPRFFYCSPAMHRTNRPIRFFRILVFSRFFFSDTDDQFDRRKTNETAITVDITLDGTGKAEVRLGSFPIPIALRFAAAVVVVDVSVSVWRVSVLPATVC